jgi:hypothetical protein
MVDKKDTKHSTSKSPAVTINCPAPGTEKFNWTCDTDKKLNNAMEKVRELREKH